MDKFSLLASILANSSSLLRVVEVVVDEELLKIDALVALLLLGTSLGGGGSLGAEARLSQLNGDRRIGAGFSWTGVEAADEVLFLDKTAGVEGF